MASSSIFYYSTRTKFDDLKKDLNFIYFFSLSIDKFNTYDNFNVNEIALSVNAKYYSFANECKFATLIDDKLSQLYGDAYINFFVALLHWTCCSKLIYCCNNSIEYSDGE